MNKTLYSSIGFLLLLTTLLVALIITNHKAYSDNFSYPKVHKISWNNNEVQQLNDDETIHISITGNNDFKQSFKNAIKQWNSLKIIKLKLVSSGSDTSIVLHGNESKQEDCNYKTNNQKKILGYTNNTSNDYKIHGTIFNVIVSSNVHLMNYISKWPIEQKTRIALHELGHALGFGDDVNPNDQLLIMYGASNKYNCNKTMISNSEIMTLKSHYYKYLRYIQKNPSII
ncbi:hypothetical protein DY052_07500 [Apilactobacillus timberlakei]|uniref:hypothetical protein n=1 Tax=Apilactobacillus timberlakei TaxID=2008380 RepID=UPI00112CF75E|nr:hypothetical protein [Apilactobacillus timberlakei]TPR13698.1 hypothetical protein DY052_07500 [Apilactobacillus timberlakei]